MSEINPVSLKFKFLDDNLNNLVSIIKNNQSILRMIYYLTDDPLALETTDRTGNTVEQVDVTNDMINSNNYILTQHFDSSTIEKDSIARIFINPLQGNLKDLGINNNIFTMDLVIPNIFWNLEGQGKRRAIQIAIALAEQIDNQVINSIGRIFITNYKSEKLPSSDSYSYMTLFIKIDNASISGTTLPNS